MKSLLWMGSSKADLLMFPGDARRDAGFQLRKVQGGMEPSDWKSMATIDAGVREIRIREDSGAFRVIYLASRPEGVYVLHCFQKKTEATSQQDIELARKRLKAIPRRK